MKGRTFIITLVTASIILGCGKEEAQTPVASGGPGAKPTQGQTAGFQELKIEDLQPGKGEGAKKGDMLTMLYLGKLTNGTVFDGNMDDAGKPIPGKPPFSLNLGMGMVIPGWDKGLVGVKVGGLRKLSIPSELGYGAQGSGSTIPPNSDLIFTVKCLDIVRAGEELVIDTTDLRPGSGPAVKPGDKITVHYVGKLLNGTQFDSSRDRKQTLPFTVGKGEVVPGFDKGVIGMRKGGLRKLRIPPQAAYGAAPNGQIPANSVLTFEVELVTINGK